LVESPEREKEREKERDRFNFELFDYSVDNKFALI